MNSRLRSVSQCFYVRVLTFNVFGNNLFFRIANRKTCKFAYDNKVYSCDINLENMFSSLTK